MVAVIVVSGIVMGTVTEYLKEKSKVEAKGSKELEARIAELENRMENLETILIQREKDSKWEALKD